MKWNYLVIGLLIMVVLIGGCVEEVKHIDKPKVITTTDKTGYKQGDIINITILNEFYESIFYYHWWGWSSIFVEKESLNKTWEVLNRHDAVNILPHLTELKSNETANFWWNQKINDEENNSKLIYVPKGKYRIKFTYWKDCPFTSFSPTKDCKENTVYSNEFKIINEELILEFGCCHLCRNIPSDKPDCEVILRSNNITNDCLDYFQNNPHSVFECQEIEVECEDSNDCKNINCYDTPIKHGFESDCVDNQCKCMCYGCE